MSNLRFPRQMLPFTAKTKEWRKKHLVWAADKTCLVNETVRQSVEHKKINYDLIAGKLHMADLQHILNPTGVDASFVPDKVQHYAIMLSKLNVLRGEELDRTFDYRVIITNPNAVSQIETAKKDELFARIQDLVADSSVSEEQFDAEIEKLSKYYTYEWQDIKEIRANSLLNHYSKEQSFAQIFNAGFMDALTVGEEIYQCDIISGEPVLQKINPMKIRVFRSGFSSDIEDADVVILEDYWSPSRIIDTFFESLSQDDVKYIENLPDSYNSADEYDERNSFIDKTLIDDEVALRDGKFYFSGNGLFSHSYNTSLLPYDFAGNVRVIRMYWKSRRAILKVKGYDQQTGEETVNFYPENYKASPVLGETVTKLWINEAWEGTLIGDTNNGVYVNMRPRPIQYNRLYNPSKCHFGIIGSFYSINEERPVSMVDLMKPYNYLYDVVQENLNHTLASNWGSILEVDLAKIPKGWTVDKWMYYAKINHIAVIDSYKEGTSGASLGKLAGGLNNAGKGIMDSNLGNYIQQQVSLLEYIKQEMQEVGGVSRQREGQVSNRETVGGIERATLQSSHITEWLFAKHDSIKKRVLECFLETAKVALKGRSKKFQYILPDLTTEVVNIDGDEFAECDYGLVVDSSVGTQKLQSQIETLAQAALQNQLLSFSSIMKLYSSASLAEKQRIIEADEREIQERQQQAQQQQAELAQQQLQQQAQLEQQKMQQQDMLNARDNETKLLIATMSAANTPEYSQEAQDKLTEAQRQFDASLSLDKERLKLDKEKLSLDKTKADRDYEIKKKQVNKPTKSK